MLAKGSMKNCERLPSENENAGLAEWTEEGNADLRRKRGRWTITGSDGN